MKPQLLECHLWAAMESSPGMPPHNSNHHPTRERNQAKSDGQLTKTFSSHAKGPESATLPHTCKVFHIWALSREVLFQSALYTWLFYPKYVVWERSEKHRFSAPVFPEEFIHGSQFKTWISVFVQEKVHNRTEAGKAFLSHGANMATWNTKKNMQW